MKYRLLSFLSVFVWILTPYVCVWQLTALQSQLEFQEQSMVDKSLVSRQEAKIRELETKLEFEKTQVKRLEVSWQDACVYVGCWNCQKVSVHALKCQIRVKWIYTPTRPSPSVYAL